MASRPTIPKLFKYDATRRRWLSTWYDDQGKRRSKPFGFDTNTTAKQARARYDYWMLQFDNRPDIRNPEGADAEYTITRLAAQYLRFARQAFLKDGKPTSHVWNVRYAMRALRDAYGTRTAASIELKDIDALRDMMIWGKDSRPRAMKTVNTRLTIVVRSFVWAAGKGRVPASVAGAISLVERLTRGRSKATNPKKVKAVPDDLVEQTLPHLPQVLQDMVKFLNIQGCRPEEACSMRVCELETTGDIWLYRPRHKMEHKEDEGETVRFLGPRAQEIIKKYLKPDLNAYIFSPFEAHTQRLAKRREDRKTKLYPSHAKRLLKGPSKRVRHHFETQTLRKSIHYACAKAGIPKWNPNQLRHAVSTRLRKQFGSEMGMQFIGHKHLSTFEIYAEKSAQAAMRIAREVG